MLNVAKVALVCIGRFHHFDLARQLAHRGMLAHFFTGYPRWKLRGEQIPMERVSTFPWVVTLKMGLLRYHLRSKLLERQILWFGLESLDHYVSKNLPECDVVLALSGSGLRSSMIAKGRGIKFICDRGSAHIRYQNDILRKEFSRWGDRFSGIDPRILAKEEAEYEAADIITVPSIFAYHSFVEMGVPEAKLRKVPYGVDLRLFRKVAEPNPERFDVLFVGQVSFQKGVPDLLKAFERLNHPKKQLRIVGGLQPEMRCYLKTCPPSTSVELLGHLPQSSLKYVMARAHVMVLPSVQDGFGLVMAQALACGCPVIATRNTGAEDLITDGLEGFIVPPRNSEAIAEKLQFLAENPDVRKTMGDTGLRRVKELGGWEDYGARMAAVLKELVDR